MPPKSKVGFNADLELLTRLPGWLTVKDAPVAYLCIPCTGNNATLNPFRRIPGVSLSLGACAP
jgi:hypothetical protein